MTYLLGIDIGTSSTKAVLYDPKTAQVVAQAAQDYGVQYPAPNFAEQAPATWWSAVVASVRQLPDDAAEKIAAIGLSGQMHGTVLIDADGEVLHPAIIWADGRSSDFLQPLVDGVGQSAFVQTTGTLPAVGFVGPTLLWLQAHMPDLLARAYKVLLPKDYIHYRLTDQPTTEPSDAAGTALFDVQQETWATDVIEGAGLTPDLFPQVIGSAAAFELTRLAADELGLPPGIPVVAGCADQPAQALGNGIVRPGTVSVTLGSGGQIFAPLADFHTDERLHVFNHAVPGTPYALGAILSAGLSLTWLRDLVDSSYEQLSADAAQVRPGADGLIFLPYLSGERTPHRDPYARGSFIGLGSHHGRGHLARAVMEGVAFALRQTLELTTELSGGGVERLIGSGGGVESDLWRGILTDVLNQPLSRSLVAEQAAVGAAVLAGVGVGVYTNFDDLAEQQARYADPTEPTQHATFYQERYQHFKTLYPKLKTDFHRLSKPN